MVLAERPVFDAGPLDLDPLMRACSDLWCSDIVFLPSI